MSETNLKILHLATSDALGGAAIAARRVHESLLKHGVDSRILVRYSDSGVDNSIQFQPSANPVIRAVRIARRAQLAIARQRLRCGGISPELGGLTDPRAETLTSFSHLPVEVDLVHLHKVEGFVDWKKFFRSIPPRVPIAVTLHDLSPLTGGCDYPGECTGYQHGCGSCPALPLSHNAHDFSTDVFRWKDVAYAPSAAAGKLCFIANSRWTAETARSSALVRGAQVECIHFGVDSRHYHPRGRDEARSALGIPPKAKVVLAAAHDLTIVRKGALHTVAALARVAAKKDITVLSFGRGRLPIEGNQRNLIYRHFGPVDSECLQGLLYRCADVFVMPSLEEAFGMTALEAAACGCMVAGFDVGGLRDIVTPPLNGRLVSCGSNELLEEAILELLSTPVQSKFWINQAESWIASNFSSKSCATKHLALYRQLCDLTRIENSDNSNPGNPRQ